MTQREYIEARFELFHDELSSIYLPKYDKETQSYYIEQNLSFGEAGMPSLEEYKKRIYEDIDESFCLYDEDVEFTDDESFELMFNDAFSEFEVYYNTVKEARKPYEEE